MMPRNLVLGPVRKILCRPAKQEGIQVRARILDDTYTRRKSKSIVSFIMCLFIKTKIILRFMCIHRRKRLHEQGIPFQNACGNYTAKDESHDLYLALNRDGKSLET